MSAPQKYVYADFDVTPAQHSRYIYRRSPEAILKQIGQMLPREAEGQIGIYDSPTGVGKFHGYVIKQAGEPAHFEAAEADEKD